MYFIIGSGPAGIACAHALIARGQPVTLIDTGLRLEPGREALRAAMSVKPQSAWTADERALLAPHAGKGAVPDKLSYGSDYPYRGTPPGALRGSHARGGLSNVWGSAILPYRTRDMQDWPLTAEDLAAGYAAALKILPLSATADALVAEFPLHTAPSGALPRCRQVARLMTAFETNTEKLRQNGITFGSARLAVHAAPCILCGNCLNGCPRELIYSARQSLPALTAAGLTYIPNLTVKSLEEAPDAMRIHAIDATGTPHTLEADKVFLAAGVLNTAEIMLRASHVTRAVMKDSQYFILPWAQLHRSGDASREALHTLAQAFIEIDDPAISPFGVHLQVYGYNNILAATLKAKLGPLARIFPSRLLLDRMLILQGYLHSAHSGRIEVTLQNDRPVAMPIPNRESPRKIRQIIAKLNRLTKITKAWPAAPLLQITDPGRGFHAGGAFPMSAAPAPGQTDLLGRPHGHRRLHIVDASVFPSIPATTITLTAMANAWRIGNAAAGEPA